jgi:hypothetical protein
MSPTIGGQALSSQSPYQGYQGPASRGEGRAAIPGTGDSQYIRVPKAAKKSQLRSREGARAGADTTGDIPGLLPRSSPL